MKEDITIPSFIADINVLFEDVDKLMGLDISDSDPTKCVTLFQSDEHITEVFKWVGTTEWLGTIWK